MNRVVATLLSILVLAPFSPLVHAADATPGLLPAPIGVRLPVDFGKVLGYDWSARPFSTHLVMNALTKATVVSADNIHTTMMDVEVAALVPGHSYELFEPKSVDPNYDIGPAGWDGHNVFWNLLVRPDAYILWDRTTNESVSTLLIAPRGTPFSPQTSSTEYPVPPNPPVNPPPCHDPNDVNCRVTSSQTSEGFTIAQAALSFSRNVTIMIRLCADHTSKVDFYVSGGAAAAKTRAGQSRSYSEEICDSLTSNGSPQRIRTIGQFQVDTYGDGSRRAYLKSTGNNRILEGWDVYWGPDELGGAQFTMGKDATNPTTHDVIEKSAGGVYFSGETGAEVPGFNLGLGTTVAADASSKAEITITTVPSRDGYNHTYQYFVFRGSPDAGIGMIPFAWEIGAS